MDKSKKKELVSEWKERHPVMGVFCVKCIATGVSICSLEHC